MDKMKQPSKTIYTAHLDFLSRGQKRGGYQWSTKRTTEALTKMGYECTTPYEGTLIQRVVIHGRRNHIIKHRTNITNQLKMMSGGKISIKFQVVRRYYND